MELVIVESPAKAKTIENFLGKDFTVKSSYGHVRDLPKSEDSIDLEHDFKPNYVVLPDKKNVIKELKSLTKKATNVWLATDEDREGEAISWHLAEVLELNPQTTKRIVFHEITKSAILNAINAPRLIDINLVNAQQARRVLDRLVGFKLSPVLWKKVKPSLSAGRVQSVAVRLIVEREKEITDFKTKSFFKTKAIFTLTDGKKIVAEYPDKIETPKDAEALLNSLIGNTFSIKNIETKPGKRSPAAPFTTSTLQQEASRKLGYSVAQTMSIAQKLYEAGKITYMRTDSLNLSDTAMAAAKNEIVKTFGANYANPRKYSTKSKGAQEAHEAIRPTYMNAATIEGSRQEQNLYDLIYKRTLASQMADAQVEKTQVEIGANPSNIPFIATAEVLKFDGFLKVYTESTDEEEEQEAQSDLLPPLKVGENLYLAQADSVERFTQHPPRYTEASLVKKLENLGIGRPSTYAPTISTIQKRGYVVKEDREGVVRNYKKLTLKESKINTQLLSETTGAEKKKLFPTDIGIVVNDFLVENFQEILDFNFTAEVEKEFDLIAEGNIKWQEMIKKFYAPFNKNVIDVTENSEKATGERLLGTDPKTGKNVYARIGRFGPMAQIGETTDEEKPKFASIKPPLSINTVSLNDVLPLFDLPKSLGNYQDKEVSVGVGRFGPYIKWNNQFVSIPKGTDPLSVDLDDAINLIIVKQEAVKNAIIKQFDEDKNMQVLNGRFGPYIKFGKQNIKIPKGTAPESLTYEDCVKLAEKQPVKKKGKK